MHGSPMDGMRPADQLLWPDDLQIVAEMTQASSLQPWHACHTYLVPLVWSSCSLQ
jgi:hypothetical protein